MTCEERICPLPDPTLVVSYSPSGSPSQPSFCCQAHALASNVDTAEPGIEVPQDHCSAQIAAGICPLNREQMQLGLI